MKIDIVLGTQFGDEGKGKTVDYLCSQYNKYPLVVRFSGGQQCGHTVMNEKGKHVHASFPSGTLRGMEGYIMEYCTVSPIHMFNEWEVLKELQPEFDLTVHPLAMITTPYDIAYNRFKAKRTKHGSCGMGVGATMMRNHHSPYKLHAIDLLNPWLFWKKVDQIGHYFADRIRDELDFTDWKWGVSSYTIEANKELTHFKNCVDWFVGNVEIKALNLWHRSYVIFEGSQGILLDMDHGIFPHVTYANTTCKNIQEFTAHEFAETYYVTRAYSTRHGAGPLKDEDPDFKVKNTKEEINTTNEWQGEFRYAPLDLKLLKHAIMIDKTYSKDTHPPFLCVNGMDQIDNPPDFEEFTKKEFNHPFQTVLYSDTPESRYQLAYRFFSDEEPDLY